MRLILDTNVLISAALWGGTPRRVLEKAYTNHTLCFSLDTLQELERVLRYPKLAQRLTTLSFSIEEYLVQLTRKAIVIMSPAEINIISADPEDNKFLACAKECEVQLIVSSDKHLLNLKRYEKTKIVSVPTALKLL